METSNEFNELIAKFRNEADRFIATVILKETELKNKKKELTIWRDRYPFLKEKPKLPFFKDLAWHFIQPDILAFSEEEIAKIRTYIVSKICGIYKHAQSMKTALCNDRICQNAEKGVCTIAFTKNTIDANTQWLLRLISDLTRLIVEFNRSHPELPPMESKDMLFVCSSKVPIKNQKHNQIGSNSTHCKNISEYISILTSRNHNYPPPILLLCSNNARVKEINILLKSLPGLHDNLRFPIEIQWDEAHNMTEGIPSKRVSIEHILFNPYVIALIPCTATADENIADDENPLWRSADLENRAINYANIEKYSVKSSDSEYSALCDAGQVTIERVRQDSRYKEYNITEFERKVFIDVDNFATKNKITKEIRETNPGIHGKEFEDLVDELWLKDIDRRRQLEFHIFMTGEIQGYNDILNVLDNWLQMSDDKLLFPFNEQTIHVIQTPNRKVLTRSAMIHALDQPYKPICIGLYGGKINLMYHTSSEVINERIHSELCDSVSVQAMNDKVQTIIEELNKEGVDTSVPIIIMGNYIPTGESITFVNSAYGVLRSVFKTHDGQKSNADKDYQTYCRCCYMVDAFKRANPAFECPPKFIIGTELSIANAIAYEKRNDDRVDRLRRNIGIYNEGLTEYNPSLSSNGVSESDTNIAIPVKIIIDDPEDENIVNLRQILLNKITLQPERTEIMRLFGRARDNQSIIITDKTGKFNFTDFTLKSVRRYRKKNDANQEDAMKIRDRKESYANKNSEYLPFEADYRFESYHANFNQSASFMNDKSKIKEKECDLTCCIDRYEYIGTVNNKNTMWLSYRF
jgi:hypothetical protein